MGISDLDAANKLVRALAPANAYDVFLQGYDKPIVKLSRSSTVDEIRARNLLVPES